jgi:hypothetical protein
MKKITGEKRGREIEDRKLAEGILKIFLCPGKSSRRFKEFGAKVG